MLAQVCLNLNMDYFEVMFAECASCISLFFQMHFYTFEKHVFSDSHFYL